MEVGDVSILKNGPYWEDTMDVMVYAECDRCGKFMACGEPFWMSRFLGNQVLCRDCRDDILNALDEDAADTVEETPRKEADDEW